MTSRAVFTPPSRGNSTLKYLLVLKNLVHTVLGKNISSKANSFVLLPFIEKTTSRQL